MTGTFWTNLMSVLGSTPKAFVIAGAYHWQSKQIIVIGTYAAELSSCVRLLTTARGSTSKTSSAPSSLACFPCAETARQAGSTTSRTCMHTQRYPFLAKTRTTMRLRSASARSTSVSTKTGTRISNIAAADARRNSRVTSLVQGGVGLVHVAKDVPKEAFTALNKGFSYFGKFLGPGPAISCEVMRHFQGGGADNRCGDGREGNEHGERNDPDRDEHERSDDDAHVTADEHDDDDERDERRVVGSFLDLWNYDLSHWDLALALTLLSRALALYEPLVILSESAQVSTLLALDGPTSIRRIPEFGEPPTPNELDAVEVGWRSWADANWWTAQGRIVICQYAPGCNSLLAMVAHGGSIKYDPARRGRRPTCSRCRTAQLSWLI